MNVDDASFVVSVADIKLDELMIYQEQVTIWYQLRSAIFKIRQQ
ncbi:MAG: hypothetical protein V7K68_19210 [Nostoc sp.]